jgi:AraC-like DNA-binding protein
MYLTFIDIILIASIVQSLALSVFLLLPANIRMVGNQLLVVTLVCFAAGLAEIFLYGTGLAERYPNLAYVGTLISLLQAGTLYLYAKSLMFRDFKLRKQHAVHTLLFWVVSAIFVVEYYLQPTEVKIQILLQRDHPGVLTSPLLAVAIHGVVIGYLYATIRSINQFGVGLRKVFSNIKNKQLAWLRFLLVGYSAVWTISMFYCLAAHVFKRSAEAEWIVAFGGITGFLFINYLFVNALKQPVIFTGLTAEEASLLMENDEELGPGFVDDELKSRLLRYMKEEKPYLYSNLTVAQLARRFGMQPRELSQLVNQGFNQNFFEFIGHYRIEEAKSMLAEPGNPRSILDVMYEAGFNSKSVFNTAFKKATGLTPSQYRNKPLKAPR